VAQSFHKNEFPNSFLKIRERIELPEFYNRDYWFSEKVAVSLAILSFHIRETKMSRRVLAQYCQIERLDKDALAVELGIPLFLLARLALCKRPDSDSPDFAGEITEIADFVPVDERRLVRIIREVDSLNALGSAVIEGEAEEIISGNPFSGSILAAARDRGEDENDDQIKKDDDTR
jgi:hypothetical protein